MIQFFPAEEDASVLQCIQRRILLFQSVGASAEGWRLVVDGGDPDELCSSNHVGGGFGVASCNAMNAEHRLRQRIGVLSGSGAEERITIK
jgi:hypothetical protein